MAKVEDPQGVKGIKLQYLNATSKSCTTPSGAFYSGTFVIALPGPVEQTLPGTNGQTLTMLPLLTFITGPLTCSVPGGRPRFPLGHTFTLRATGTNWSSNVQTATASKDLAVTIQ